MATSTVIPSSTPPPIAAAMLTRRQMQVRDLLLQSKSNKEIAAVLSVSLSCAKFHVSNVLARHKVRNRVELIYHLTRANAVVNR